MLKKNKSKSPYQRKGSKSLKNKKSSKQKSKSSKIIKMVGKKVPHVVFKTRVRDAKIKGPNPFKWQDVDSNKIFKGRRVVVFALPGAYTPTCSSTHLPRFEQLYDKLLNAGIDEVYCLSVNDAFVMYNWGKHQGVKKVKLLPDGSAEFTNKMGALVKKDNLGFGRRSWRYSMVVDDGVIEKMFIEEGIQHDCMEDPFEVSDAETMLRYLKKSF